MFEPINSGEGTKGYSLQFRHLEYTNAYNATTTQRKKQQKFVSNHDLSKSYIFHFNDASPTVDELDDSYGAMQYIDMFCEQEKGDDDDDDDDDDGKLVEYHNRVHHPIDKYNLIQASQRCSLIRYVYEIVGVGETYADLAKSAVEHGALDDMMNTPKTTNSTNTTPSTWSLRLREYGDESDKNKRYGTRKRSSMSKEREALKSMSSILFSKFEGSVNLSNPDCPLHILEGLNFDLVEDQEGENEPDHNQSSERSVKNKTKCNVLVRGIAAGMKTSTIAPNSRICITRTPLCPIAAFLLCNIARIKDNDYVLDPFAGSCTTLLASTMMAKNVKTVGVEIAPNDVINREKIRKDFESRGLDLPNSLIEGDITDAKIRDEARDAINGDIVEETTSIEGKRMFDAIVADPPYGIREKMNGSHTNSLDEDISSPLVRFIECMAEDRLNGKPLLRKGGRLVAFVPTFEEEDVNDGLPQSNLLKRAGLEFVGKTEQPMSHLSRWMVVYRCIIE